MPLSSSGGSWLSGDVIGKTAMNTKTNLVIPSGTYTPVIGTDTVAGMFYIDTTTGMIRVMNSSNTVWNVVETSYLTRDPIGFAVVVGATANYVNPDTTCTIAFTNATRTFTITPTGANFKVYIQGLEYVFTTAQNVTITNSEGLWFIYIDATGTITASQTYWDLSAVAAVAYIYWDVTDSQCIFFADERHMITMDWRTHQYLHNTIGCRYASGLAISGYTLNTSGDSNVEVGFSNGICYDEDLEFLISNGVSGTPASTPNFYNMPLTKPATIPVFYQIGNTGVWRKHSTTNFYLYPDSNPRPYYNLLTGSTWSLASTPSGSYVSYWIFASNDIDNPIIAIMGQQTNTLLTNAINNDTYAALSIASTGLPFVEMKLLYRVLLSVNNSFGGSTSSRVQQVDDFRAISLVGGVAPSIANFITSVDAGYFTVSSGQLTFTGTHAQAVGSGDSPSFAGLTVTNPIAVTGPYAFVSKFTGSDYEAIKFEDGTGATLYAYIGYDIFGNVLINGNTATSITLLSNGGATLTGLLTSVGANIGTGALSGTHAQAVGSGDSPTFVTMTSIGSLSTTDAFLSKVTGDASNRFEIQVSGKLAWSDGTNPADVNITRSTSNTLTLTGKLIVTNSLVANTGFQIPAGYSGSIDLFDTLAGSVVLFCTQRTGDTNNRYQIDADGNTKWGTGSAVPDVTLYRTGIGVLTVNGSLTVSSTLTVTGGMAGTHGQNIGTGDSPTFAGLTTLGSIYVGTAYPVYLGIANQPYGIWGYSNSMYFTSNVANASASPAFYWQANNPANIMQLNGNGNLLVSGTVQIGAVANTTAHAAYVSGATGAQVGYNTSCLRFKDNIVSIEDSSWIYNLRPVEFDWKDPERSKREGRMIGLIAEEVQALYPKICEYEKGELTGLHYEWLAVPMIVELKKLRDRVDLLESKLNIN